MKCIFWMLIWMWWSGCDERTTDKPKFRLAKRISYAGRPAMPLSTLSYRDSYRAIELPAHSFRWMGIEIRWLLGMRRFRCHFNEIISFRNSTIRILLEIEFGFHFTAFPSMKLMEEAGGRADDRSWRQKLMEEADGIHCRLCHSSVSWRLSTEEYEATV